MYYAIEYEHGPQVANRDIVWRFSDADRRQRWMGARPAAPAPGCAVEVTARDRRVKAATQRARRGTDYWRGAQRDGMVGARSDLGEYLYL